MSTLKYSPAALQDLDEILSYISSDRPDAARSVVTRIRLACERLLLFPNRGERCDWAGRGVRRITAVRFNIYFRQSNDGILLVLRILHGAREQSDSLED
jgi:toxin ParE1/3/4